MKDSLECNRFSSLKKVLLGLAVPVTILIQGCAQLSPPYLPTQKAAADPVELTRLGDEAYAQGDFDQAQRIYQTLTATKPQNFSAWFKLGNASLHHGLVDQAERAYLEALKQDSSDPKVWYNLATARLMNAKRALLGAAENLQDSDPARRLAAQRLQVLNELIFKNFEESAAQTEANRSSASSPSSPRT